ncbi:hypothetical protein GCM10025787_01000 [Saccharopolyspora rosea]
MVATAVDAATQVWEITRRAQSLSHVCHRAERGTTRRGCGCQPSSAATANNTGTDRIVDSRMDSRASRTPVSYCEA